MRCDVASARPNRCVNTRAKGKPATCQHIGRTNAAPSPRDAGGRHAVSPADPQSETRNFPLHRGEGERRHRERPLTLSHPAPPWARGQEAGAEVAEVRLLGWGHRRVSGAASREGLSRGLRKCCGGGRGRAAWGRGNLRGRRGLPARERAATLAGRPASLGPALPPTRLRVD
jgi:hypothetical protein